MRQVFGIKKGCKVSLVCSGYPSIVSITLSHAKTPYGATKTLATAVFNKPHQIHEFDVGSLHQNIKQLGLEYSDTQLSSKQNSRIRVGSSFPRPHHTLLLGDPSLSTCPSIKPVRTPITLDILLPFKKYISCDIFLSHFDQVCRVLRQVAVSFHLDATCSYENSLRSSLQVSNGIPMRSLGPLLKLNIMKRIIFDFFCTLILIKFVFYYGSPIQLHTNIPKHIHIYTYLNMVVHLLCIPASIPISCEQRHSGIYF